MHRYMLNGDGTDSVGGANGTLNDPGGTASFSSTALTTTNANSTDFLSLPSSVGTGITGDFSIEDWLTQSGSETAFTSIFSLSTSTSNFILLNPNRNGTGTTADFDQPGVTNGGAGTEANVNAPGTTFKVNGNFGTELQIVLTYVSSTGIASIYNDGTLLASGNVGPGFSFQAATAGSFNGIGGGDAFSDPDFMGSTDDFRIYSQALTPTQISALGSAGPNATNAQINGIVPEPSSVMVLLGFGALIARRRRRGA
jgi:Concanavalin A-like lectin/glucanases superfamily/PEP-CTERM motif